MHRCGHNFTVAVIKVGGELYAWGEGGCGQLGIGECVKSRDKPVRCSTLGVRRRTKPGGKGGGGGGRRPAPFVAVSCGWAHVLARNADGEVYGESVIQSVSIRAREDLVIHSYVHHSSIHPSIHLFIHQILWFCFLAIFA